MTNKNNRGEPIRPGIPPDLEAAGTLVVLARAFLPTFDRPDAGAQPGAEPTGSTPEPRLLNAVARYQVLLEQLPAVTFMAAFEQGLSEIYVSPQIEALLGYTVFMALAW